MTPRTAILAACSAALVLATGETALADNKPIKLAQNNPITGINISLPANPDAKMKANKGGPKAKSATNRDIPKGRSKGVSDNSSPLPRDR